MELDRRASYHRRARFTRNQPHSLMNDLLLALPSQPVAAIGWSILYLLFGGGILGAIVIFIVAKIFRK